MRCLSLIAGTLLVTTQPVHSQTVSKSALLQYQYDVDVDRCSITLANGLRVEFSGVWANEGGDVTFHEIVNLVFKSDKEFPFASLISIRGGGKHYLAKVVWFQGGQVKLAVDAEFLSDLWGSGDIFSIYSAEQGGRWIGSISLPENEEEARVALSRARSCQIEATRVD